ncbi:hypothetical protein [Phenylobacterium sp.]|uniref:hypothetical protein n=1 Tax=Phenylobacterium sp. TaxID=1871053 RepID=UPI00260A1F95|nr:hypothetical protein [Phenylobacterium sp.]
MAEPPQQLSLFGEGENRMAAPAPTPVDHPARAREKLNALLALARRSQTLPWPERDALMWETVFPQMANWLPDDEADTLRAEFAGEIARLRDRA